MTDDLSPAARLDQEHHLAEIEAARAKVKEPPTAAPPPRSRFVTRKRYTSDMLMLTDVIGKALAEYVAAKVDPLLKRIAELEKRNALSFAGTWREDRHYRDGDLAQHGGSLWMCTADTTGARPNHSSHWRLLIKRGTFREEAPK